MFVVHSFIFCLLITGFSSTCFAQETRPLYARSAYITGINFHFKSISSKAKGSDIWPVTWAANNKLYTAWGDGKGFSGTKKVSWVLQH